MISDCDRTKKKTISCLKLMLFSIKIFESLYDFNWNHNFIIDTIPSHGNVKKHWKRSTFSNFTCIYERMKSQVIYSKVSFFFCRKGSWTRFFSSPSPSLSLLVLFFFSVFWWNWKKKKSLWPVKDVMFDEKLRSN